MACATGVALVRGELWGCERMVVGIARSMAIEGKGSGMALERDLNLGRWAQEKVAGREPRY